MKHSQILNFLSLCACTLLIPGCSNEETPDIPYNPANDPDAVELGITAGVALTKSAIDGGEQSGSDASTTLKHIAVYASGDDYTAAKSNNYALYIRNSSASTWATGSSVTDKIMLTSKTATIYAYHPAYEPASGAMATTTALKLSGDATSASTIPVTVFVSAESKTDNNTIPTTPDNADKSWTSSWGDNSNSGKILSAPGEVDYMWGLDNSTSSLATTSNGKASGSSSHNASVSLTMKHAMAMVSFRIYNDGTYKNTGSLTKIKFANESGTVLKTGSVGGTKPTMNIATGAVTAADGTAEAATYYRYIGDGFTLKKIGDANIDDAAKAKEASPKFSIIVFPETTGTNKQNVQVTFTIDGADYPVSLPDDSNSKWEQGKNYLYTAVLSGKELTITSVTVEAWSSQAGSDSELPVN